MPIYEYECPKCGVRFEEIIFGDDVPACPACGAADTHKLLSCTCFRVSGGDGAPASTSSGGKSCAGCSGGNCSSCG